MPLDIQLPPYTLDSVLVRDSYLTHYNATGSGRAQYIATEFYPTYMADRAPNGSLNISERFTKEFDAELNNFKQRAAKMDEIQGAILPIEGVVENNNTAYVVRRVCAFTTIENYMNNQRMEFKEAFLFMRPLLLSLGAAQSNGVVFNFTMRDLRVTPQRQLMLDATFAWEADFTYSLVEVAKLYFKLVTGHTFSKEQPSFKDHGVNLPPRIEEIFNEVLSGEDILYGSIDDFFKRVRREFDAEMGGGDAANASKSSKAMGTAAFVLTLLLIVALGGLVYGGLVAYRASNRWIHTEFADATFEVPRFDFTQHALTHPRNTGDALGGSFHFYDIFLFSRSDWGRPVMARRAIEERALQLPGVVATEEETIFIDNVLPSFINTWTLTDDEGDAVRSYIFFVDGLSDNRIYRATLVGANRELTRITEQSALHMTILEDYLYFANHDRAILYRVNLHTLETRPAVNMPIFGTATDGERLLYLSGPVGGPFGVYASYPDNLGAASRLAQDVGFTLLYDPVRAQLFFNNSQGHIIALDADGYEVARWDDINALSFTVDGRFIIFVEPGHLNPRVINMNTGDRFVLDTTYWLAYIWARNGVLYGIDHVHRGMVHMLQLP